MNTITLYPVDIIYLYIKCLFDCKLQVIYDLWLYSVGYDKTKSKQIKIVQIAKTTQNIGGKKFTNLYC